MPRLIGNFIDVDGDASDGAQDQNTSVATLSDGRFVVSWTQREQVDGGNGFRIYYRVFNASGSPVTEERKIDSQYAPNASGGAVVDSTVTALPGGGFVIGFLDMTGFLGSPRVSGFKYWTAAVTGPNYIEARSNLPQNNAQQGAVATLANGQAITAVSESNGGSAGYALVVGGQTLFSTSKFIGSPPGIAPFGDGYVVVYSQRSAAPIGDDVLGLIKATGFSDAPFMIHADAAGGQTTPNLTRPVVALKGGGFVVSWNDGVGRIRVYGADGSPRTDEILVAPPGDDAFNAEVAGLDDGSFVVVWPNSIRHFLADGTPVGDVFTLALGDPNVSQAYSIASLGGSRVVYSYVDLEARAQIIDVVNIIQGTPQNETLNGTATYDELTGLAGDDVMLGLAGDDVLLAGEGADSLTGGAGNDALNGGAGVDTAIFSGLRSAYTLTRTAGGLTVTDLRSGSPDGADTLVNVERLQFSDYARSALLTSGADYDGAGRTDLLFRNVGSGGILAWDAGNSSTAYALGGVGVEWAIALGDLDGDNRTDIIFRNAASGQNVVWNGGLSSTAHALTAVDTVWKLLFTGDFDGDGRSDLFFRNSDTNAMVIWKGGDSGNSAYLGSVGPEWTITPGDIDGDGKTDLIFRNTGGGNVVWKGGDASAAVSLSAVAPVWTLAAVGDFDGDGKADLAFLNTSTGAVVTWSGGDSAQSTFRGVTAGNSQVFAGDFNGDAYSDLFLRDPATGALVVWDNADSTKAHTIGAVGSEWQIFG